MRSPAFSPFSTDEIVARPISGLDFPRFEIAAAAIHKSDLARSRLKYNHPKAGMVNCLPHGASRLTLTNNPAKAELLGIWNFKAHLELVCRLVYLRGGMNRNAAGKRASGGGRPL